MKKKRSGSKKWSQPQVVTPKCRASTETPFEEERQLWLSPHLNICSVPDTLLTSILHITASCWTWWCHSTTPEVTQLLPGRGGFAWSLASKTQLSISWGSSWVTRRTCIILKEPNRSRDEDFSPCSLEPTVPAALLPIGFPLGIEQGYGHVLAPHLAPAGWAGELDESSLSHANIQRIVWLTGNSILFGLEASGKKGMGCSRLPSIWTVQVQVFVLLPSLAWYVFHWQQARRPRKCFTLTYLFDLVRHHRFHFLE